jgi:hypothetical protein
MSDSKQRAKFILTPILNIIKDAVRAAACIPHGVVNYPLKEYFMQSTFLKVAGAFEQKLVYMVEEINEIEKRPKESKDKRSKEPEDKRLKITFGISYDNLKAVYEALYDRICGSPQVIHDLTDNLSNQNRKAMIHEAIKDFVDAIKGSPIIYWEQRTYQQITKTNSVPLQKGKPLSRAMFFTPDQQRKYPYLLCGSLEQYYNDIIYTHRNFVAHNVYAKAEYPDKPSDMLVDHNANKQYCTMLIILLLLDKYFMTLFGHYRKVFKK